MMIELFGNTRVHPFNPEDELQKILKDSLSKEFETVIKKYLDDIESGKETMPGKTF